MTKALVDQDSMKVGHLKRPVAMREADGVIKVGLLTGGDDKTYAFGLTDALVSKSVHVDFIGSSALDSPHLHGSPRINFLNLRGDQNEKASARKKVIRIIAYYARLVGYAATARPRIFHILWNNKFELIDRTILMVCYKVVGKKIAFTAHNINAAKRDCRDSWVNRVSLGFQYWMADHIFVHTNRMKDELIGDFRVSPSKVSVIPFGINNVYPRSTISCEEARKRLDIRVDQRTILFFGQIAPYKGLEYLVAATARLKHFENLQLIIAGKVKAGHSEYWLGIKREIGHLSLSDRVVEKAHFIPDEDVELYFKAADALILPYTHIFQSGLPFLAYSFGLPVIASDVGSIKEDIVEGQTGFVCAPRDPGDLANTIEAYFSSDLYMGLATRREEIRLFANQRYSWSKVAETTVGVYQALLSER